MRQRLLSWSGHVESWLAARFPVCVIRYEDMKKKTLDTFCRAVHFAGLEKSREQVARAIALSSFDELTRQEREKGFRERSPRAEKFFRKGEIGSWRHELRAEQVERIIRDHREVMVRFGYLGDNGEILC